MSYNTTLPEESCSSTAFGAPPSVLGLAVVWSAQPGECGRVILVPPRVDGRWFVIGRGEPTPDDPHPRLLPQEDRPGNHRRATAFSSPHISRAQMLVGLGPADTLAITNIGKTRLLYNGLPVEQAELFVGDTLQLGNQLLMLCIRRPAWLPARLPRFEFHPFGRADKNGIVGESAVLWSLREQLAYAAIQREHVLVSGESGTGKELLVRALHALSERATRALVSRNASTFPETLIDSELFGNAKNYPNVGTPERLGLFGEAVDSSLFLDEIAELPAPLQTHLLRVLDSGEYQRLGEGRARRVDVRLIGATNRPAQLRPDLAARFKIQLRSPGLDERREDIPLLAHAALRSMAGSSSSGASRLFPNEDIETEPRISLRLMRELVQRDYVTHFRELEALLWQSLHRSEGDTLQLVDERSFPSEPPAASSRVPPAVDPATVSREMIESTLQQHDWVVEQAWRVLGLSSRHVLTRLIARYGLRRPQ